MDKPVYTWRTNGGREHTVSLFGQVTPPADVQAVAPELARLAVENATLREALTSVRLESPNVELHAALEGVTSEAEKGFALWTIDPDTSEIKPLPVLARAKKAIDRHKPRPVPGPVVIPPPAEPDLTPPAFGEERGKP